MNTIFIDMNNEINKEKKLTFKEKIKTIFQNKISFSFKEDIFNSRLSNIFYLNIYTSFLDKYEKKHSLVKLIFEKYLKFKLDKISNLNFVLSENVEKNSNLKNYLNRIISSFDISINELKSSNTMKENDLEYIKDHIEKNNIKLSRVKLLVVIGNIDDYDNDKMLQYISNYKFVDILRLKSINKYDYLKLQQSVNNINNEYGTTIEITQKRNIQEYNFYLVYSNVNKDDFLTSYNLSNKGRYIDMKDPDEYINNTNMISYKKYKDDIIVIFNRLDININNFKKNKLGKLFLED